MDELEYSFKPTGQISVFNIKPNYSITFLRNENGVTGKEVGKFDFNGPKMVFTGDAEESAKVFIEWVARSFHGRLEEERKAAQPAVPDALNPKDENPAYAAGWNDCRAEMLKGMKP
jgi:hypothetical protein